jgi:hypothetical protein
MWKSIILIFLSDAIRLKITIFPRNGKSLAPSFVTWEVLLSKIRKYTSIVREVMDVRV